MLLLALMQAAPAPVPPEEDVVVIGRKLSTWRGAITSGPLGTRCKTSRSTGDREIDAIGCTAMERCWPETLPRLKAARGSAVPKAERKTREAAVMEAFVACARPHHAALIQDLRARRAAARGTGA